MKNRKNLKYVCYAGASMFITGFTSFSNHPEWGYIWSGVGGAIVIAMKITLWRTRLKASN